MAAAAGLRYCGQSASRLKNLSSPARNGTIPNASLSAWRADSTFRSVVMCDLLPEQSSEARFGFREPFRGGQLSWAGGEPGDAGEAPRAATSEARRVFTRSRNADR